MCQKFSFASSGASSFPAPWLASWAVFLRRSAAQICVVALSEISEHARSIRQTGTLHRRLGLQSNPAQESKLHRNRQQRRPIRSAGDNRDRPMQRCDAVDLLSLTLLIEGDGAQN